MIIHSLHNLIDTLSLIPPPRPSSHPSPLIPPPHPSSHHLIPPPHPSSHPSSHHITPHSTTSPSLHHLIPHPTPVTPTIRKFFEEAMVQLYFGPVIVWLIYSCSIAFGLVILRVRPLCRGCGVYSHRNAMETFPHRLRFSQEEESELGLQPVSLCWTCMQVSLQHPSAISSLSRV